MRSSTLLSGFGTFGAFCLLASSACSGSNDLSIAHTTGGMGGETLGTGGTMAGTGGVATGGVATGGVATGGVATGGEDGAGCAPEQTACLDDCVTTDSDPNHCGGCGITCDSEEVCDLGDCLRSCQAERIDCNGACIDPLSNDAFCGASDDCAGDNAGATCAAGETCFEGACVCQPGLIVCGESCIDPLSNDAFCGASDDCTGDNAGATCAAGETCFEGACVTPVIDVSPTSFHFELGNDSEEEILEIFNIGNGVLNWSLEQTDALRSRSHFPSLDEVLHIPHFSVVSPPNGGSPVPFTVPTGVATRGEVIGFRFEGTVSGLSGNSTWASDMCMWIDAPDGTFHTIGGVSTTITNCSLNPWDFQGISSTNDGTYTTTRDPWRETGLPDGEEWTFTFINAWNNLSSAVMNWSNVTITLRKAPPCYEPSNAPWLTVTQATGNTVAGDSNLVSIVVDASGLDVGTYETVLCISSNDPVTPLVEVPVSLEVIPTP